MVMKGEVMLKCILWGLGRDYDNYLNQVRYQVLLKEIEIIAVTSNATIYEKVDGYNFIAKNMLQYCEFDLLIIMSISNYMEIKQEAINIGIAESKIVSCKIFSLPNLSIKQYLNLANSNLTIIANMCWGGIIYHHLCMEFLSPTINMYILDLDYIKLLKNLKQYMEMPLVFKKQEWDKIQKKYFPVCLCGDIELYCNHYRNFDEVKIAWIRRKNRINWDNLFIMMHTENPEVAEIFAQLPYERKVCFVPFETQQKSLLYIDYQKRNEMLKTDLWTIVNGTADGIYKCYNILDLLDGKEKKGRLL